MKVDLILLGTTEEPWLKTGIGKYALRLRHYVEFSVREIPAPKGISSLPRPALLKEEAKLIRKAIAGYDRLILLDERGNEMGSQEFAGYLQKLMNAGVKKLAFVVGGPFGFDDALKSEGHPMISLSRMTFSHQIVRLLFTEQLYRAFTILKGESYHHE